MIDQTLYRLQALLDARLVVTPADRQHHSQDISWRPAQLPDAVCYPESTEEVVDIVRICDEFKTPVIPYGAGTSVEGHIIPINGGVTVDLSRMNKILQLNPIDKDVVVEAGVGKQQLNEYLKPHHLFFAAGPGVNASLGGMMATRASGANAVRYGTAKENVRSLKVVTPTTGVIQTRRRVIKSSAGYDLTQLFVGSEGTLGIITEVTAVLHVLPEFMAVAVMAFPSIYQAVHAAIELNQKDLPLAMLELMDEVIMSAINKYSGTDYPAQPTLFLELHCREWEANHYLEIIQQVSSFHQCTDFRWAADEDSRKQLFKARYEATYAFKALRPGTGFWPTDVTVPISRLSQCLLETKKSLEKETLPVSVFGHVGDGNFHTLILFDPLNETELEAVKRINHEIVIRALSMEGTCTGEHGVGQGKRKYLELEFDFSGMELMRRIKQVCDPNGIMNPGKIL